MGQQGGQLVSWLPSTATASHYPTAPSLPAVAPHVFPPVPARACPHPDHFSSTRQCTQLSSTFLYEFKNRGPRDHSYAVDSTTYFVAEFFGWLEVIRRQVVFITG